MDTLVTNHGALEEEVIYYLNAQLDKRNTRGGYNNTSLMEYFQRIEIIHKQDFNIGGGKVGGENK